MLVVQKIEKKILSKKTTTMEKAKKSDVSWATLSAQHAERKKMVHKI